MKKLVAIMMTMVTLLTTTPVNAASTKKTDNTPDKYTQYIRDYTGKNLANVGYTAIGGFRADMYGNGWVKLTPVTKTGKYIDPSDEELLKTYVVSKQDVKPDTELKYSYYVDPDTKEESTIVTKQTISEILLYVKKVDYKKDFGNPVEIKLPKSADSTTWYIRNYVGRNLNNCGYNAIAGDRREAYGNATVILELVSDDGTFIDIKDEESLKKYVVTEQSVEPNTKLTFDIGEYDIVSNQNIQTMELHVKKR